MNEQQKKAAEHAEILLAFSRGERLQIKDAAGRWLDRTLPHEFPDVHCQYRVAPKPVERWAWQDEKGAVTLQFDKDCANNCFSMWGGRVILMREVTE